MSLKAKLEAVIYAAEEPVTLAQLATLFAADALEWKAALEAAPAPGEDSTPIEAVPLLNAEFEDAEMEQPSAVSAVDGEVGESPEEPADEPGPPALAEPVAEPEAEAKRLARQRDREVRVVLRGLLDELIATYASDDRGIEIKEIAGGYRMATKPECHDAARAFVKSLKPAMKLSLPALETLAVIAYKQPVTAPEVNEIRGVESSGVFGSLLARKLIATAGRKQVIGRPILYKTTKEFLLRFGLKDVTELPSMEEFEKMAQLEFDEMEPAEESADADAGENALPEVDDDPDMPLGADSAHESSEQEGLNRVTDETAARADSKEGPEIEQPGDPGPELAGRAADASATTAETSAAEDAPAAPSPTAEQAETETVPHE